MFDYELKRDMVTPDASPGRTWSAQSVAPHVAERCLNHKIKDVAVIYNRNDYFEARKPDCRPELTC